MPPSWTANVSWRWGRTRFRYHYDVWFFRRNIGRCNWEYFLYPIRSSDFG